MKNISKITIIFIILILVTGLVLNINCSSSTANNNQLVVEEEETKYGTIKKYYNEEGDLVKEEYPDGTTVRYLEDGEVIEFDIPNQEKLIAYKVSLKKENIFTIKNFTYKDKIQIDSGKVFLAKTVKGYIEAIIFPDDKYEFLYSDVFKGEIEYLYIRFSPEKYDEVIEKFIVNEEVENKSEILKQAEDIHYLNFSYMMHISEYALIDYEHLSVTVKILDKNLFIKDFSFEGKSEDFKAFKIIEGRLTPALINWNVYKNDIFKVYYPNNSVIKDSPDFWLSKRQKAFDNICDYLGVKWEYGEISFYVFNDRNQGQEYDLNLGFAVPNANEIYTLHNQSHGHELAHLISYRINDGIRIQSALINEGLATFLNGNNQNYHRITKYFIEKGELDNYSLLNDSFRNCPAGYQFGASFVNYLIDEYSLELFKEFFGQQDYTELESFEIYYNKDYETLYKEWKSFLIENDFGKLTEDEKELIKMIEDNS